jgi:hypothetical protein
MFLGRAVVGDMELEFGAGVFGYPWLRDCNVMG